MLKYIISSTELLIAAAIDIALIFAYIKLAYSGRGKIAVWTGLALGAVSSAVMAFMRNGTRLIDTFILNLVLACISLAALVLFFIFAALRKKLPGAGTAGSLSALAVLIAAIMLYVLPEYIAYPYTIWLNENSAVSTDLLFKIIGMVLGFALVLVTGIAVNRGAVRLSRGAVFWIMTAALAVNSVRLICVMVNVLITKRFVKSNSFLFGVVKFSSNHSDLFIYGAMAVSLIIPAVLLIKVMRANEPYDNPAQKRKIRKKRILIRRWSATVVSCLVISTFCMTAVKAYVNKPVELSPVEHAPEIDGNICVSFEMVEDGHLHRFGYSTESGKEIRFIVIKKPNSSSYGIGLDACDICGETGYYEKDGQVVCKLCDVVMNINTIGFKGGCNPIVIDYRIENGQILVPIAGLLEHEKEFK
ncbi:MAG: DUF2318 domain-containing protein [Ruminiclostridium sp.]|nr:DUF2318 domain-containing protein [Ruminiclostridium sp.]